MVYHLFERIFNPDNFKLSGEAARVRTLIAEGFSKEEAEQVAWLQNHQVNGKILGLFTGGFALYCCNSYFHYFERYFPRLRYQPFTKFLAQATTVYFFFKLGDYYFTSRRYGSNDARMNGLMYSNTYYSTNKEALIQNFEPLNRKFTEEEVEQFLRNEGRSLEEKRNWIYNPHIHGSTEGEWKADVHEKFDSGKAPWERENVKAKILETNKAKIDAGEEIQLKPFKTLNHLDKTGILHRIHPFIWTNNWTLLG
ncbi:hypothetical protein ABPG74_004626 [Tetrahymena malaccensis]